MPEPADQPEAPDPNPASAPPPSSTQTPRRIGTATVGQEIAISPVGVVYDAFDETTQQPVRLKIGHRDLAELRFDPARLEDLEHPGITALRDAGTTESGETVLVDDVPAGQPLEKIASAFEGKHRAIALFIREAAAVLSDAHARGVTHGDISPRTLRLGDSDEPIFAEFGMGLITGVLGGEAPLAEAEADVPGVDVVQRLERKFKLDERADLYAVGAVLYWLLCGREPSTQPLGLMSDPHALIDDDIAPIDRVAPDAPAELRAICNQLLSTDPVYRYLHAETLVRDLDAYLYGRRSKPYVKIALAAIGALMVGLFGLWGAVGGGSARIVDATVYVVRADRSTTGTLAGSATRTLAEADRPLSRSDTFFVQINLSKAARVSVYYRAPTGSVTRLGGSPAGERADAFRLPLGDQGWRVPSPGGVGVLLIVSHSPKALPPGLVEGVIASAGQPPRRYTAMTWRGASLPSRPEPVIKPVIKPAIGPARNGPASPYPTFSRYADRVIKDLREDADDVVDDVAVGILYVVGV